MKKLALLLLIVIGLITTGCRPETTAGIPLTIVPQGTPTIRVRILDHQSQLTLTSTGTSTMDLAGVRRELRLPAGAKVPITLSPTGWHAGATPLGPTGPLTLTPDPVGSMAVNSHAYRGVYRLVPVSPTEFDVVNDVDIDSYLMGVLAKELLPKWHIEAYKAQAIVARTYALYEAKTSPAGRSYDLNDDTRSQVYAGISGETEKSRAATVSTAGIVVAYGSLGNERIFKAYFSACCGGATQSPADAFGDYANDIPPLAERTVGRLCAASPHFDNPPLTIDKLELTRRAKLWGVRRNHPISRIGTISRIETLGATAAGRPTRFLLTDIRGSRVPLRSEELRNIINTDASPGTTTPTSYMTPTDTGRSITFTNSHGHGHGVGFCQYCAQALAEQGTRHEDIVIHEYPKAKLVRAY